jgi:alanine racemase
VKPQAIACINTAALKHNLQLARQAAPGSKIMAVIKANAYGHGMDVVARALSEAEAFAVGTLSEAERLRQIDPDKRIVILQGVDDAGSLAVCAEKHFDVVLHSQYQIDQLCDSQLAAALNVWIKVDTGMHRLGLSLESYDTVVSRLNQCDNLCQSVGLMSHLACADEPERPENDSQLRMFSNLGQRHHGERTLCNSAGIFAFPEAHYEWVRPGIMLYGISPLKQRPASELGLQPVMTLKSRLIAINEMKKGDAIGYGATWTCPEDMRIGVVGIGYGDGYPRHAPSGTPVIIRGERVPIVGRVSMDLITVDLRLLADARVGDEVVLWGEGLPIEDIASRVDTIGYELVCRLTSRIEFKISGTE